MKGGKLLLLGLLLASLVVAGRIFLTPPGAKAAPPPIPLLACRQSAPASVLRVTPVAPPLMASLVLKNQSQSPLTGFRIGWMLSYGGQSHPVIGPLLRPVRPIAPGQTVEVPAQGSRQGALRARPDSVSFFIAQVNYGNGRVWKPMLRQLGCEAGEAGGR
jgi:hypothetical protein